MTTPTDTKRPSLASQVIPNTPGKIIGWHTLLTGIGISVCGFLAGTFIGGIPRTRAGWMGILVGVGGAAASRFFGFLGNLLETKS